MVPAIDPQPPAYGAPGFPRPAPPPPSPWSDAGTTLCMISTDAVTTYIADMCSITLRVWHIHRVVGGRSFKATISVLCPEMWMRRRPRVLGEILPRIMEIMEEQQDTCRPSFEITYCRSGREEYCLRVPLLGHDEEVVFQLKLRVVRIYDVQVEYGIYYIKDLVSNNISA